ncbi:MAG: hypothetical protein ABEJ83_04880 [Candidatus Nanohaloarchaea archaeon]
MIIRPDPIGALDLLVGIMLLFTPSPLPLTFAYAHSGFLIFKGAGTIIGPFKLRWFGTPLFVFGGAADILSAAILFVGQPPILAEYKAVISLVLAAKGGLTLVRFL